MRQKRKTQKGRQIIGLSIPALLALLAVCALTGCGAGEEGRMNRAFSGLWSRPEDGDKANRSFSALWSRTDSGAQRGESGGGDLLILVNPWNPIPDGYAPKLVSLSDGTQVDARCYDDLRELLRDCRAAGCEPYICSAYRSAEEQAQLFENKVRRVMDEGYDESSARELAAREVAVPGTSEHQLGLALDIIDSGYTTLDEGQAHTNTQRWLMENSWRYGFILRYEQSKSELTGIIFEPWHYRYVGKAAAAEIHSLGLCLEEYLERG